MRGNSDPSEMRRRIAAFPTWYHRVEIAPGIFTPGISDCQTTLELLRLPQDCKGMRALDIGARDGFFSFELERRGAEVLAIDSFPPSATGFMIASELLGSKVRYEVGNVYDLSPDRQGKFDVVLFLGVLYHLRHPLLALDKIWTVCRDSMWLESHVIGDIPSRPPRTRWLKWLRSWPSTPPLLMQFYPRNELNQDYTNWWGPNMQCLRAMLESSNFSVESEDRNGQRGIFRCRVGNDAQAEYYRQIDRGILPVA